MSKARAAVGILAGLFILACSAMHSLLGWKLMVADLGKTMAPPDLVKGLAAGWHWGGASMFAFGLIALATFVGMARGRTPSLTPVRVIGLVYTVFGIGAFALDTSMPFFLLSFALPGVMLLFAAWPGRGRAAG